MVACLCCTESSSEEDAPYDMGGGVNAMSRAMGGILGPVRA
jgi:hypothetical protein